MPHAAFKKPTRAERDTLSLASFGDPANKEFPVHTQSDLDAAATLIGTAKNPEAVKRRLIKIATAKGLTIPDAWTAKDAKMTQDRDGETLTVEFSASPAAVAPDGMVVLRGKAFSAGEYKDKGLTVTPRDLLDILDRFDEPVPMNLEHRVSALSGKSGAITDMWTDDDGEALFAEVHKPAWLHALMPESRVSVEIPLDDEKRITGCAWTSTPRVTDAQLVAAFSDYEEHAAAYDTPAGDPDTPATPPTGEARGLFSGTRHDTRVGQRAMQNLHDMSTQAGAVCKRPAQAHIASAHEAKAVQQVHDMSVEHGATCDGQAPDSGSRAAGGYGLFSGGADAARTQRRPQRMNLLDWIKNKATEDCVEVTGEDLAHFTANPKVDEHDKALADAAAKFAEHAAITKGLQQELEEQKAERQKEKRSRIESEGAHFAESQILAKKALPPEKEAMVALYVQAALDDANTQGKTAAFSEGTSRVSALVGAYEARPSHTLTAEMFREMAPTEITALFTQATTPKEGDATRIEPSKRRELLSKTPDGCSILDEEDKKARAN